MQTAALAKVRPLIPDGRKVLVAAYIPAKLYENVTAYKLAMNQDAETDDALWNDDDVLYAALVRGIESLDATTQHLLRRVPT